MALTVTQLNEKLDRLFDLRLSGNKLTVGEIKEIEYYRELLSEYFAQRAAGGITNEYLRDFSERFQQAEALYTAAQTGTNLFRDLPVQPATPQPPVRIDNDIDPSNPTKFIRDVQNTGQNLEDATKTQEFSKLQGVFNEFSNAPTFIETIKNTIAQNVEPIPVAVTEPVPLVINADAGFSTSSIEILKNDVSQILQTGEIQIEKTVELNIFAAGIYGEDAETAIRATSIKQDTLDPTVQLINTAINPFTVTTNQLAQEALILVSVAETGAALAEFEQNQLLAEQSAAVESFSGGG